MRGLGDVKQNSRGRGLGVAWMGSQSLTGTELQFGSVKTFWGRMAGMVTPQCE